MDKRIAILLHGEIDNDNRVLKTCKTLSTHYKIDLYFVGESALNEIATVSFIPVKYRNSLIQKIRRHTFFCREYSILYDAVIDSGNQYDIVWSNDLPTLAPAMKLARKFGAKLIYDAHEIYNETLNQFFPQKSSFPKGAIVGMLLNVMRHHGRRLEKKISRHVDLFITVNDSLGDYFQSNYGIDQPLTIMNFPNQLDKIHATERPIDYRLMFSWSSEDYIFIYQGVLNQGRGLTIALEAINDLPPNFKLIILGNGPLEPTLTALIARHKLSERVKMIPKVSITELAEYTSGADFGVNLLEDLNLSKKLASPNKLFEYIHASIPVVCSDTIENRKIIDLFSIGILTRNDPTQIGKAMIELTQKSTVRHQENRAIFDLAAANFNWEVQEHKLMSALAKLFND